MPRLRRPRREVTIGEMQARLLMAVMVAVIGGGCNALFGLDAPVGGGGDGGGDRDGGDAGDDGDAAMPDANPDDRDGDGVNNDIDNCPDVPNALQAD